MAVSVIGGFWTLPVCWCLLIMVLYTDSALELSQESANRRASARDIAIKVIVVSGGKSTVVEFEVGVSCCR